MKKKLKRILSAVLVAVMLVGTAPTAALAVGGETEAVNDSTANVQTSDDLSRIVMSKVNAEEDKDNPYGVTEIEIKGKSAEARLVAPDNCTLIAAVYSEDGKLIGKGLQAVDSQTKDCTVSLSDITLPEYYIVKGFIVDSQYAAVCKEYVNREHTKAYEEFMDLTVNDFDSEYVLNYDESEDMNFAVLNEGTIKAKTAGTVNILKSYDEATDTYVIANADSTVKGLKKGDTLYLQTGEENSEYIIAEVKSIKVDGNTVTIVSGEESVESVFECIKIDSSGGLTEESIKNATLGDALTLKEQPKTRGDVNIDNEKSKELSTVIDYEIAAGGGNKASVKGSLGVKVAVSVKIFYDKKLFKEDYFEYEFSHEEVFTGKVTVTGKIAVDKEKFKMSTGEIPIPGTPITFEVSLFPILEFSGSVTVQLTCTSKFTQSYNPRDGQREVQEKDKEWDPDVKEKIEIKFGVGIEIKVKAVKLIYLSIGGSLGIDISGDIDGVLKCLLDKYHYCDTCVEGDIRFFVEVNIQLGLEITKKLKWKLVDFTFKPVDFKLSDFYCSTVHGMKHFGFQLCPYKMYRVEFNAKHDLTEPVSGAVIKLNGGRADVNGDGKLDNVTEITTNKDGKATAYFDNGMQSVEVSAKGYETKTVEFRIDGAEEDVNLYMSAEGTDPDNPDNPPISDGDITCSYNSTNNTLTISGNGYMKDYSSFNEAPWLSQYKESIKKIVIEDGVKNIGDYAFAQASNIQSVDIADTVEDIGIAAFYECRSLESVTLPNNVKIVDDYAFYDCYSMSNITAPSLETIGMYSFAQCDALNNVAFSSSMINIGNSAFAWCDSLKSVTISNKNCLIYDSENTFPEDTVIYAPVGSNAQSYANKYGRNFGAVQATRAAAVSAYAGGNETLSFSCSNCKSGNDYILLNVTNYGNGFILSTSNLEYIDQITANASGEVSGKFIPQTYYPNSTTLLIGDFGNGIEQKIIIAKSEIDEATIKSVVIDDSIEIKYKDSRSINPTITADEGIKYTVKYESSNPKVVSVDENGNVYGAKKGSADITVTVTDEYGNTVSDTCTVNVSYTWWQWLIKILLFGWIWY